jgi:drug/metabolite transporter superfamily protein YnfA
MPSPKEQKIPTTYRFGSIVGALALRNWHWLWSEASDKTEDVPTIDTTLSPELKMYHLDSIVERTSTLGPPNHTQSPETQAASAPTVTGALKFIAWLGASAGGLTILLVVLGFLAVSAHDSMLGIPRSIQNNPEYVAVGGLFFGRSIIFLVSVFVSPKSWMVLGVLLIGVIVLFNIPRRPSRGRSLVIGLCSVGLLGAELYALGRLIRPLQISNLLLNFSLDPNSPGRQVVDAILVKDTSWLGGEYGFLVLLVLSVSTAFILLEQESCNAMALRASEGNSSVLWRLLRVPAFTLMIICLFLLPRAYGILTISNDYPEVSVDSSSPSVSKALNEARFLLREDEKAFILYDPSSQSIVTIKRELIEQHKIYAPQHIFSARSVKK